MKQYVVLYRDESFTAPADQPFGFHCYADDADHAEVQCMNANPDCHVVWVWHNEWGVDMQTALDAALDDYCGNEK